MESQGHEASETREGMEDSECSCDKKGKRKGKCAACMSKDSEMPYSKRGDALTSQEYLTACDLGIADRPRTYIRARLDTMTSLSPSALRADKKCGASAIPDSKQCRIGSGGASGSQSRGGRLRNNLETAGMATGVGLAAGGLFNAGRQLGKGNLKAAGRSLYVANAGNVLSGLSMRARGERTGNKQMVKASRGTVRKALVSTGVAAAVSGDLGRAASALRNRGPRRLGTPEMAQPKPSMRTKAGRAAYQASYSAGRAAGSVKRGAAGAASRMGDTRSRWGRRRGSVGVRATSVPRGGAMRRRDSVWAEGFVVNHQALAV